MSADEKTRLPSASGQTGAGTQLSGIYELDQLLGAGGMGEVWRGHNIQTGDPVAIKIVLPEFARDQTILSLFRKEASILNHLSHEAVVRYHVFTIDPGIGRPYLAMEFVDGDSLHDVMRRGPVSADAVRRLCHRLASGLGAVHQAGAIHRDLSPDNIILPSGSVERAKIIDFGIARSAQVGGETLIGGRFAGKYNYVSPEQLGLYGGEVSERSDIYSLGLVLAAALKGKPLEMSGSQLDVIEKRRSVPDLTGIDGPLRPIIEAMLQPDPEDRPATMEEIAWATRDKSKVERENPLFEFPDEERGAQAAGDADQAGDEQPRRRVSSTPPSPADEGNGFVEHVRPAVLEKPRVLPGETAQQLPRKQPGRFRGRGLTVAAGLLAVAGGVAWWGGLLPPWGQDDTEPPSAEVSRLEPAPSPPPDADEAADLAPLPESPPTAEPEQEIAEAEAPTAPFEPDAPDQPPAAPVAPAPVETPPATDAAQEAAGPAAPLPDPAAPEAGPSADSIVETLLRQADGKDPVAPPVDEDAADPVAGPTPAAPPIAGPSPLEEPAEATEDAGRREQAAAIPLEDEQVALNVPGSDPPSPVRQQIAPPAAPLDEAGPDDLRPPPFDGAVEEEVAPSVEGPQVESLIEPAAPLERQPASDASPEVEDELAYRVPLPAAPEPPKSTTAEQVAWLREFSGGDCFFASALSVTSESIRIEGFGVDADPFSAMHDAFESRFGIEPDIEVRLIEPAQCEVTRFLRGLPPQTVQGPDLRVDQMSIPSGGTLSGGVRSAAGMHTHLLLIDHAGMVFSLDPALAVKGNAATFAVPITLDAGDNRAGKPLGEMLLAISTPAEMAAAAPDQPLPASTLLPRILSEIGDAGGGIAITAKYFQIGG